MALQITNVRWKDGFEPFDQHVLPGPNTGSPPLRPNIIVDAIDPATQVESHFTGSSVPGGDLQFVGEFVGQPNAFGVKIAADGSVTATSPLPADRLFNFQIRVVATDSTHAVALVQPRIRVHVHGAIAQLPLAGPHVWLTPAPLTIRVGADGQRLTFLAEFDDGTIGDLTRLPGLGWTSSAPATISVDPATGALKALVPGQADVTVKLPAAWGGTTATATVKSLVGWASVPAAAFRVGAAATAPNSIDVLFLPDGFDAGPTAQQGFERLVQNLVTELNKNPNTFPLNRLGSAINYWRAWIEAPGASDIGCSVLHEVAIPLGMTKFASEVPLAVQPDSAATTDWQIEQLLDRVGLPVQVDGADDFAPKLAEWTAHFGPDVAAHVHAGPGGAYPQVFVDWLELSDRRLLDEQNTVLGVVAGSRPRREGGRPPRGVGLNPMRTTRAHLDVFLNRLTDGNSATVIGNRWDSQNGDSGKFVIVLANLGRFGGSSGNVIALSLSDSVDVPVVAGPARALKVAPLPSPDGKTISLDLSTTVAHETGHGFGLGDEYAKVQGGPLPAGGADGALNLLELGPTAVLTGNILPWNWPRIHTAAMLTNAPVHGTGTRWTLPVKAGDEKRFAPGDVVQLRKADLVASTQASPSASLKVANGPFTPGALPADVQSGNPGAFGANDTLFAPVVDGAGQPRPLVAKPISDFINGSHQSLETKDPCQPNTPNDDPYQHARNLPAGLPAKMLKMRAYIVGAWRGGAEHQCGVFHPTGTCMMRRQIIPRPRGHSTESYQFCHVCRYILVDQLDPSKHADIDAFYAQFYPD